MPQKKSINVENYASWVWTAPPKKVASHLSKIESKLQDLGATDTVSEPFPQVLEPPGNFNEGSVLSWIESVHTDDHIEILNRFFTTCRQRLGHHSAKPSEGPSDQPAKASDFEFDGDERKSGLYGVVRKARQISLSRDVAIKIIRSSMVQVADALAHAQALARVKHPNIVTVYQVARVIDPDSTPPVEVDAVVMEWVDGESS